MSRRIPIFLFPAIYTPFVTAALPVYSPEASASIDTTVFGSFDASPIAVLPDTISPWYTTGWAYISYTLLAVLALYAIWQLIIQGYRRQRRHKLCRREVQALHTTNRELMEELETRNAEIFSQSSMLLARNELIASIRDTIADFNRKYSNKALTPLLYKINTLIDSDWDAGADWRLFLIRFEQKHAGFFRILKERFPDLTSSDLRLCACLRLHLGTKEIAALMNLTVRAVENSRYRLRKKLGLQPAQNLNDFLMNIDPAAGEGDNPKPEI